MDRIRSIALSRAGQTTAEYALILLVAGLIVGAFAAFIKTGTLNDLFDAVVVDLVDRAKAR